MKIEIFPTLFVLFGKVYFVFEFTGKDVFFLAFIAPFLMSFRFEFFLILSNFAEKAISNKDAVTFDIEIDLISSFIFFNNSCSWYFIIS